MGHQINSCLGNNMQMLSWATPTHSWELLTFWDTLKMRIWISWTSTVKEGHKPLGISTLIWTTFTKTFLMFLVACSELEDKSAILNNQHSLEVTSIMITCQFQMDLKLSILYTSTVQSLWTIRALTAMLMLVELMLMSQIQGSATVLRNQRCQD